MTTAARPWVWGSDGQIGRALRTALPQAGGTSRRRPAAAGQVFFDLAADPADWVLPADISTAYVCAAWTSLEACRRDPRASAHINVTRTVELAGRLAAQGAFVVFLSTNLVYDGALPYRPAADRPCPQTEYGRQKAEAERRLLALGPAAAIVRLTKVIPPGWPLFQRWRTAWSSGQPIQPLSDLVLAPLSLPFVVQALSMIGARRLGGFFQLSGERDLSYADAAQLLARRRGVPPRLIQPVTAAEAGLALEAQPVHTTLADTRVRQELNLTPPSIEAALAQGFD